MSLNVSQSKVRSWRNCRQQYHYKHVEQIQPRRTRRPFAFGKVAHRLIEAKAQDEEPMQILNDIARDVENAKVFDAEREEYGDIVTDLRTIMTDYFEYWSGGEHDLRDVPVKDETGEFRYAEHEFAIPLEELVDRKRRSAVTGVIFKGQIDGLARTPNKLRWVVERKTFDKLPGDDERWRNLQSVVYVKAVLHLKWLKQVDGICWDYVKSKPPTVPQLLKSGDRLSVREIVTLPSVVLATLKLHKLRVEDHKELLARADQSRHEYFQRIFTPLNQTVLDSIFDGFVESAIEMREHGETRKDKNIGRHCSWCDYEPLCRAELNGADLDYVKDHDYQPEDPEGYRRTARGKRSNLLKIVG
jgi:PD-(D/E)XK nuclease superfamily